MINMDNVIFNVNGRNEKDLLATIKLRCSTYNEFSVKPCTISGYVIDKVAGMVLIESFNAKLEDYIPGYIPLPSPMSAEEILPLVLAYLRSDDATSVALSEWDGDKSHDGNNEHGWRLYVEDWGHIKVEGQSNTTYDNVICAIKRIYAWYGK